MIKCKECGGDVSAKAAACPKCGAPVPKPSWILRIGGGMLLLATCTTLVGRNVDKPQVEAEPTDSTGATPVAAKAQPAKPRFAPTVKEEMLLRSFVANDLETFLDGGESKFGQSKAGQGYSVVSADALQRQYERNEVAGDQMFRGRRLAVRGKVAEIKRSLGENYFIELRGGSNQFMRPMARMADGYVQYLAGLAQGDNIHLVCEGDGMLMGSAVISKCVPGDAWMRKTVDGQLAGVVKGLGSNDGLVDTAAIAVVAAGALPDTSPCYQGEASVRCNKELQKVLSPKFLATLPEERKTEIKARLELVPGAASEKFKGLLTS